MISLLSRPLHLISIDNNFTVTLYFYSDLKSCLPYQIRMGRGLHWDPFTHWWSHKNGHNLSQKKRHSNRFLKKISKGEFFLQGDPAQKNEKLGILCAFNLCIGAEILSHSLWILKVFLDPNYRAFSSFETDMASFWAL